MRAMARTADGRRTLVEIKAVDAAYPLYGAVALDRRHAAREALAERDGVYGAAVDPALLTRLDLKPGDAADHRHGDDRICGRAQERTGQARERDRVRSAADRERRGVARDRPAAAGQPGALELSLKLPDERETRPLPRRWRAAARAQLPNAGWEIRTRNNASPALERNVERFTQYLTLVGLTALLVGGVGVANAVKSHLDRKRDVIATMKTLGATGGQVFAIYLAQIMVLALIGAAIGLALGAGLPFLVGALFGAVIPLPIAAGLASGRACTRAASMDC